MPNWLKTALPGILISAAIWGYCAYNSAHRDEAVFGFKGESPCTVDVEYSDGQGVIHKQTVALAWKSPPVIITEGTEFMMAAYDHDRKCGNIEISAEWNGRNYTKNGAEMVIGKGFMGK